MSLAQLTYPSLVILAFAKAVEGNKELQTWLQENGYPELFMAAHAIRLQDPARQWLMKNGYPHLLAMIAAAEGDEKAQKWLKQYDYMVFTILQWLWSTRKKVGFGCVKIVHLNSLF